MKEINSEQGSVKSKGHNISITDRAQICLDGIAEVISYDENNIIMETNMGQLALDGSGLNIVKLNLGEGRVSVTGKLDALYYTEQSEKKSLLARLFG